MADIARFTTVPTNDEPIPDNVADIDKDITDLTDAMSSIDVQMAAHKAGMHMPEDRTWKTRALSAKTHMQSRLKDLKIAKQAIWEANKARKQADSNYYWHRRYHAFEAWLLQEFPEIRDQIEAYAAKAKAGGE
jgi:hypothetical protein